MSIRTIYLTRAGSHWAVRQDNQRSKLFVTKEAALRAALSMAHDVEASPVEVEIRGHDQEPVRFWALRDSVVFN